MQEGLVVHSVDSRKRTMIDEMRVPKIHDGRQEKALRWGSWNVFLLATLCAFAWKMLGALTSRG